MNIKMILFLTVLVFSVGLVVSAYAEGEADLAPDEESAAEETMDDMQANLPTPLPPAGHGVSDTYANEEASGADQHRAVRIEEEEIPEGILPEDEQLEEE